MKFLLIETNFFVHPYIRQTSIPTALGDESEGRYTVLQSQGNSENKLSFTDPYCWQMEGEAWKKAFCLSPYISWKPGKSLWPTRELNWLYWSPLLGDSVFNTSHLELQVLLWNKKNSSNTKGVIVLVDGVLIHDTWMEAHDKTLVIALNWIF